MKIIVFGATGKTGQHVWRQALEQGHDVTAFARSVDKINRGDSSVRVVQGDVTDAESVASAVAGHDAAIVALGSNGLRDKATLTAGTRNVVDGMTQYHVGRLVVVSAAGVGESWGQVSWFARLLYRTLLRNIYADHEAQEAVVRASTLDWTIVRAAILKDEPASGDYSVNNMPTNRSIWGQVGHISRADLADFLVGQVNDEAWRKQAISVTS